MKRAAIVLLITLLVAGALGGGYWWGRRARPAAESSGRKVLYWVDPMHPQYKSDKPGVAPDCGMTLEAVYADGSGASQTGQAADMPPGTIHIAPERQQMIGVTYATAEIAGTEITVRATGKVGVDETRVTRVHPKIEGWVSKTFADFTGQLVNQGDPLVTLYSPEVLASQQEFALALRARDAMKTGTDREAYENSEKLVAASRRRLELWDLSAARVEELERTRTPIREITVYSPASGHITSRGVFPGQKVSPETELYAISNLSRVWILADVFEIDLPKIGVGQTARVISQGGQEFLAKVNNIQPQIDPATRTAKIRLDAANSDLRLKPEMFVTVEFRFSSAGRVTVPADAIVNTGTRKTVFVDHGDGHLEPRSVETGDRAGDRIQILQGVRAGERVVASGAFLVDSEAQLKGAIVGASAGAAPPGGHRHD
jgi:Cu(I)/Ag(I) efflux system membrane fusion protein